MRVQEDNSKRPGDLVLVGLNSPCMVVMEGGKLRPRTDADRRSDRGKH